MSCRMVVLSRRDLCSRPLLCQINYFLLRILLPQGLPEAPRISQEPPRISQGAPWSPLESLGLPWASPLQTSSSMFTVCDACAQNQASWNTPREPREPREPWEPRKWCQELRLGAHLPHTPEARMTVVTQTPSNNKHIYIYMK